VDIPRLLAGFKWDWEGGNDGLAYGLFFDAEHFGADRFLPGVRLSGMAPAELAAALDGFPISDAGRAAWRRFLLFEGDVLAQLDDAGKTAYLASTAYTDFLVEHFAMPRDVLDIITPSTMGYWGVPADNLSVIECLDSGLAGRNAIGGFETHTDPASAPDHGSAMFPDGNSSIARLLVRALVPGSVPAMTAGADPFDIVTARLDYAVLDRPDAPVRIRLNATAVQAANTDDGVAVDYVRGDELVRVRAKQAVLACYNNIIPHLCPTLPEAQKQALSQCVRRPMLRPRLYSRRSSHQFWPPQLSIGSGR
jgi:spermidine dehydrogenase